MPAGAANWGLLGQHYTFKDLSLIGNYTRIVSASLVNEASVGYRHSTEAGSALSQQGLDAVTKSKIGYALGQFTPSINPLGIIPSALVHRRDRRSRGDHLRGAFPADRRRYVPDRERHGVDGARRPHLQGRLLSRAGA